MALAPNARMTQIEWLAAQNPLSFQQKQANPNERKTAIVCTIGPKSNNVPTLKALRDAGMNVVRLNASHGTHEYFQSVIDNAREVERKYPGRPLAIALDTKGPEMRTGTMVNDEDAAIDAGHEFYVTTDDAYAAKCSPQYLYIDYKNLPKMIAPGKKIYIDDGILALEVLAVESNTMIKVRSVNAGVLSNKKGVNLPMTDNDLPALSPKDESDIRFAVKQNLDYVFASFIRKPQDVQHIRQVLGEDGSHVKIISKIESHEGVANFSELLKETDGVMVARGDLGIEIPAEAVAVAQKMMIAQCNLAGKPVICATQMLESMIKNNRPTRAEVSDVFNAVLDGADCVMLSGETAKGLYPIEAVTTMAQTAHLAESALSYPAIFNEMRQIVQTPTHTEETVAMAAVAASLEQNAGAILLMSTSGNTARLVAKYRPQCPVLVVTRNDQTVRACHLHRGTYPFLYPHARPAAGKWQEDVDNRIKFGFTQALAMGILKPGATVVALQGWRAGKGATNSMRILSVPTTESGLELESAQ